MARQSTLQRRRLLGVVLCCFVPLICVVLIFATLQRRSMCHPSSSANLGVAKLKLDPSELRDLGLQTSPNESLRGLLLTGTNGSNAINGADAKARLIIFPYLSPGSKYQQALDKTEYSAFGDSALPCE